METSGLIIGMETSGLTIGMETSGLTIGMETSGLTIAVSANLSTLQGPSAASLGTPLDKPNTDIYPE
jgi:hypothetical protein